MGPHCRRLKHFLVRISSVQKFRDGWPGEPKPQTTQFGTGWIYICLVGSKIKNPPEWGNAVRHWPMNVNKVPSIGFRHVTFDFISPKYQDVYLSLLLLLLFFSLLVIILCYYFYFRLVANAALVLYSVM